MDRAIVDYVREAAASDRYGAYLRNTLMDLCAINSAPAREPAENAARERELFDWIEREIRDLLGAGAVVERPPINPAIADDPHYCLPGYAADAGGHVPPADQIYAGRTNLVTMCPGTGADEVPAVILQAHVDVVPRWFAPRCAGERVFGRGTCDNKAQVALLLAQIKLLREVEDKLGRRPRRGRVYQFVIDEEIGGNGSLSLALDGRFAGAAVIVHECTGLVPYCAHRGVVDYRCRLSVGPNAGGQAAELFPFVVMALESEGRRIRQETNHPMFGPMHVQTNHGRLGSYGSGAGTVCDHVAIEITMRAKANADRIAMRLIEFLDDAVADYVRIYGDKTRETDPATGRPKVQRHFELKATSTPEAHHFRIEVWGRSGHRGLVTQCDGAITKAAHLLGALIRIAPSFPGIEAQVRLADGGPSDGEIVLEGGQGFTPSHTTAEVQARMTAAAKRGLQEYCRVRERQYDDSMIELVFDRLHSEAYAGDPDSAPMRALREAFAAAGEPWPELTAWPTSCDARIYHHKGYPVAVFGAGRLEQAHSNDEYSDIPDIQRALAISTLAAWTMIS